MVDTDPAYTRDLLLGPWVRLRGSAACTIAVLLLCAVSGYLLGERAIVRRLAAGPLEIAPQHLDFGEVWEQREFICELPLVNTSPDPIDIDGFQVSCTCVKSISPDIFRLYPGETRSLCVVLDFTQPPPDRTVDMVRSFSARIIPMVAAESVASRGWELHGRIKLPFLLSAEPVDFGDRLTSGEQHPVEEVAVSVHPSIQITSASCEPEVAAVWLAPVDSTTQRSFRLYIQPNSNVEAGLHRAIVSLIGQPLDGTSRLAKQVHVLLPVHQEVDCVPPSLHFGVLRIGERATQTVTLRSRTGRPFSVTGVELSDPSGSVRELRQVDGVDICHTCRIEIEATEAGNIARELRIKVCDKDNHLMFVVAVPVNYLGVAPAPSSIAVAIPGDAAEKLQTKQEVGWQIHPSDVENLGGTPYEMLAPNKRRLMSGSTMHTAISLWGGFNDSRDGWRHRPPGDCHRRHAPSNRDLLDKPQLRRFGRSVRR